MSPRTLGFALVVLGIAPLTACSPTIRKPRLLHPGPASVQRYNAAQFDPYPQNDMGPEIVGGRPIDFMTPVPPEERAAQYKRGERTIDLATPGSPGLLTRAPAAAPVFVPTGPPATTVPGVPQYAVTTPPATQVGVPQPVVTTPTFGAPTFTTPLATQPPPSTQPPVRNRY